MVAFYFYRVAGKFTVFRVQALPSGDVELPDMGATRQHLVSIEITVRKRRTLVGAVALDRSHLTAYGIHEDNGVSRNLKAGHIAFPHIV